MEPEELSWGKREIFISPSQNETTRERERERERENFISA